MTLRLRGGHMMTRILQCAWSPTPGLADQRSKASALTCSGSTPRSERAQTKSPTNLESLPTTCIGRWLTKLPPGRHEQADQARSHALLHRRGRAWPGAGASADPRPCDLSRRPGRPRKGRSSPAAMSDHHDDTEWIEEVARRQWLIISRDRHIQEHRAEIESVRTSSARMVILGGAEPLDTFHQLAVFMCQWRRIEALLDEAGPFIYI